MICAIMQPTYFPWLGYFDMIDQCDQFILLDDVQLVKRSWQVRNRIKTSNGTIFLSIPIKKTMSRDECTINLAEINNEIDWKSKHLNSIKHAYSRSDFFDEVFTLIESVMNHKSRLLGEFNSNFIKRLSTAVQIDTHIIKTSEIEGIEGKKDDKLTSICKKIGADQYLSPQGSAEYLESESPGGKLGLNGIEVYYHNYIHPVYPQLYNEFIPYMCIIDMLFNVGLKEAIKVIRSGRERNFSSLEFRKDILKIS
jgi:hypothetical protein